MSELKKDKAGAFDLYTKIEEILGIDLRSLGLFRIALGIIIIIDLLVRASSLGAHYSDLGVVPRSLVFEYGEQPWFLSFHMLSGGLALQVILFLMTGVCALALIAGYRSRIACFFCWVLMLSLHVRNPFVNNLGDWLMVDLLFWGMFLPLGAKFSIDAKLKPVAQVLPLRTLSLATLAVLLQVCFVYFFSVKHKIGPEWHIDGTAIQYALNLDRIASGWGQVLLGLPEEWLKFMTFATLYLEKWGPVVVFFPFFSGPVRTVVACSFIAFHIGLAIFFELGIFPYLCISAWILFFPSWFWDKVLASKPQVSMYAGRLILKYGNWVKQMFRLRERQIVVLPGTLETLIAVFFLFCVTSSAMMYGGIMDEVYYEKIYKYVEPIVNTLNMKQRWDMFSPQPPKNDGWFVVAAYTQHGEVFNLLHEDRELSWSRPSNIANTYQNQRWRKYLEWVMNKKELHIEHFDAYCERLFNSKHAATKKLDRIDVYFMEERMLSNLNTSSVKRRKLN